MTRGPQQDPYRERMLRAFEKIAKDGEETKKNTAETATNTSESVGDSITLSTVP